MNTDVQKKSTSSSISLTDSRTRFLAAVELLQAQESAEELLATWTHLEFAHYLAETGRISEEDN